MKEKLNELGFMAHLNETIIWNCYKNVFCTEEADNMSESHDLALNPVTQQLFFKFKMRAQSERMRNLEKKLEVLQDIVGIIVQRSDIKDEGIVRLFNKLRL